MANIPSATSFLSLDSVTRVRSSGTAFGGPLANDLQKIMQEINDLHRVVGSLQGSGSVTPSPTPTPSTFADFLLPDPGFRDDGAMDFAVQALTLADTPIPTQTSGPATILQDTYAHWVSATYSPALFPLGTVFLITDWNVQYDVRTVSAANAWVFVGGVYIAAFASRPTTGFNGAALGINDTGLEFYATDKKLIYYWDGAAWQVLGAPALSSAQFWVGNASGVAASVSMSGDATMSSAGAVTLADTAVTPASYTSTNLTVDSKGRITAASNGSAGTSLVTAPFTPVLTFGGVTTGITYSTQTGFSISGSGLVICWIYIVLTSKGVATGAATITGLPFGVGTDSIAAGGYVNYAVNLSGLTSVPTVLTAGGGSIASLYQWGAAGVATLTDAEFTNTTNIAITVEYHT